MAQTGTLRMTRQRREIMREVENSRCHLTADEVYNRVRQSMPRISLGTVYRNLEALAEQNMLRKLEFCGGQRRYEANVNPHYHMTCEKCGCVADMPLEKINELEDAVGVNGGFLVNGFKLEFFGICPRCNKEDCELPDPEDKPGGNE